MTPEQRISILEMWLSEASHTRDKWREMAIELLDEIVDLRSHLQRKKENDSTNKI